MNENVLITGINGMDGSYMAELLLNKGYNVFGAMKFSSSTKNIEHIKENITLLMGDLTDINYIYRLILNSQPKIIFHFASISQNAHIWNDPLLTYKLNAETTLNFLEAIKNINIDIKFLNCSTSEIYGDDLGMVDENSPKNPKTPYAISKFFSHQNVILYRNKYNVFASNAICFNHESERRKNCFLTKKISEGIAKIYNDKSYKLQLGHIKVSKDWGYAPDFIEGMYRLMNFDSPEDVIFASGYLTSIESILEYAFKKINIENWFDYIQINEEFINDRILTNNYGNVSKAKKILKWQNTTNIHQIMSKMIDFDLKNIV